MREVWASQRGLFDGSDLTLHNINYNTHTHTRVENVYLYVLQKMVIDR